MLFIIPFMMTWVFFPTCSYLWEHWQWNQLLTMHPGHWKDSLARQTRQIRHDDVLQIHQKTHGTSANSLPVGIRRQRPRLHPAWRAQHNHHDYPQGGAHWIWNMQEDCRRWSTSVSTTIYLYIRRTPATCSWTIRLLRILTNELPTLAVSCMPPVVFFISVHGFYRSHYCRSAVNQPAAKCK